jgi:putative Ca2+/H+ antiporter (TMEM165/GDT1 family)
MVVIGGSTALVIQMGIAVGAGSLLTLFPVHWKDFIVGVLFLGGAAYLLIVPESKEEELGEREAAIEKASTRWKEISTAFIVIFIAEFGDLTQIQAANFEAKFHQPLEVFLASSLALVAVSFLGAYSGRALQRRVPLHRVRLGGGLIFAGLGIWTIVSLLVAVS